jgi:hypothetical protein
MLPTIKTTSSGKLLYKCCRLGSLLKIDSNKHAAYPGSKFTKEMIKKILFPALIAVVCFGCKKKGVTPVVTMPVDTTIGKANSEHISVLTQHNDNTRAGLNNKESVLTTTNVNTQQFGKLFSLNVDDQVYAQPLVVGNVPIASGVHNVLYVATVNNTIYAFDGAKGTQYWKKNFTPAGSRPPNATDVASSWCTPYTDIKYNFGIIGTPVIDSATKTMYFVARSTDGTNFVQFMHAVNIVTGAEQEGSPVQITATIAGTGDGSNGGVVSFDPLRNNQRQPLTLVNGTVYVTFASHCDWNPFHGWILGYNASTLKQTIVYNDTPNGENGGLWESGMGMAADAQGNLYIVSGNGTVGQGGDFTSSSNGTDDNGANPNPTDLTDRGESAMKLTPSGGTLQVTSYFTPTNYVDLNANDLDYGVMGAMLIPNSAYFLTGCKDGNMYLLNSTNMGGYSATANQVQQTIPLNDYLHCQPAFYQGSSEAFVYVWSENDQLRAFQYSGGLLATNPTVASQTGPTGYCGADLSVSSNGTISGTGIVWACYALSGNAGNTVSPGVLRAFDANNVSNELWDSTMSSADAPGNFAKYCSPTIANGYVYLPTFSNQVVVYGLK